METQTMSESPVIHSFLVITNKHVGDMYHVSGTVPSPDRDLRSS